MGPDLVVLAEAAGEQADGLVFDLLADQAVEVLAPLEPRRPLPVGRVDVALPQVVGLDDVGVGGNDPVRAVVHFPSVGAAFAAVVPLLDRLVTLCHYLGLTI